LFGSAIRRSSFSARWIPLLFVVVSATLVASVLMPASETGRVLALLDEDETVIEPARHVTAQIESGIAEEAADMQRYALSGDSASLRRFRARVAQDDRHVSDLLVLASHLDSSVALDIDSLMLSVERWRALERSVASGASPVTAFHGSNAARDELRDSIDIAVSSVQAELDQRAATRREAVRVHEERGLFLNAALVLIALAAIGAVFETIRRDRRRARRERALRLASESLAAAFTAEDIAQRIASMAMEVQPGLGAYIAHLDPTRGDAPVLVVRAAAGADMPKPGASLPYDGTAAARANMAGEAIVDGDTVVIPLGESAAPVGAVFVKAATRRGFSEDDLIWASTYGHLASLACEKVRLLDEARDGRVRLERMMDRRSRLMRGFSHDVKNPLGVADGYAALLGDGIYGGITAEQQQSVERVRQAIHQALSLIEDVHEISRAETGNLSVHRQPTDVADLLQALADEYLPVCRAKHLQLVVDIEPSLPITDTDPARIHQILGNLVSNAIKYTEHGSVTLRARSVVSDDAAQIVISVTDTGPGISRDWIALVFEEFSRVPGNTQHGAGLGLAISQRVAEALGCTIELESEIGHGSTFILRVPTAGASSPAEAAAIPTRSAPLPSLPPFRA
jgi:signal transduction histidine kinase